jgi:hypothetical protein
VLEAVLQQRGDHLTHRAGVDRTRTRQLDDRLQRPTCSAVHRLPFGTLLVDDFAERDEGAARVR